MIRGDVEVIGHRPPLPRIGMNEPRPGNPNVDRSAALCLRLPARSAVRGRASSRGVIHIQQADRLGQT